MEFAKPKFETFPRQSLSELLNETFSVITKVQSSKFSFKNAEFEEKLAKVSQTLDIFKDQLSILKQVSEGKNAPSKLTDQARAKFTLSNRDEICDNIARHFLDFVLRNLLIDVVKIVEHVQKNGLSTDDIDSLQILAPKLEALIRFFPLAVKFDKNDLFAITEETEKWRHLRSYSELVQIKSDEELQRSFNRFLGIVYAGNAMTKFGEKYKEKGAVTKNFFKYLSGAYYFIFKGKAKKITHLFYSKADPAAFEVWNILAEKYMLPFFELTMTSIEINNVIYIPRAYPEITLSAVDEALANGTWNDLQKPFFKDAETFPRSKKKTFSFDELSKKEEDKIQVRLLSPYELDTPRGSKLFTCQKRRKDQAKIDTLVIHIHGGGWVAMSSGTHQIFLRHWSKLIDLPIFSIDYRLSPKYAYPAALDDCWQVYNWLIDNCEEAFGIIPKKILLVGDSAGSNMSLGITMLSHKSKRRAPDGLYLAYPALSLRSDLYTPSMLKAINDEVVPYSFLELCLKSYLPDEKYASTDPLVSPILASDEVLKILPPIRMSVGDKDPLHDDCWRFLDRLITAKKDVKLTVFKGFMHGFLNYDMPMGMPECLDCVKECAKGINELIKITALNCK